MMKQAPTGNISMKRIYGKLFVAVMSLIIAIVIGVSVTYAWLTLSTSPSVSGAQVMIAGGTTILVAPDIVGEDQVGKKVHYPGEFDGSLSLSPETASYAYLGELSAVSPVSTADGVNWILPTYDSATGELKPISQFQVDSNLSYANMTGSKSGGKYIYVDFWIVSPGSAYKVRVSTDVKTNEGSSLIELPPVLEDSNAGYVFGETTGNIASVARVGFLVNTDSADNSSFLSYMDSASYDDRYNALLGSYAEKGDAPVAGAANRFTVYEPNGTLHVNTELEQGEYSVTRPLSYVNGAIVATDISSILTVQTASTWKYDANDLRMVDQLFREYIVGKNNITGPEAAAAGFRGYIPARIVPYIVTGGFFRSTATLYSNADQNGVVGLSSISNALTAGATDDVYITQLAKNTPQRVRMFIWLEGQDADSVTANARYTDFVLTIELAGAE